MPSLASPFRRSLRGVAKRRARPVHVRHPTTPSTAFAVRPPSAARRVLPIASPFRLSRRWCCFAALNGVHGLSMFSTFHQLLSSHAIVIRHRQRPPGSFSMVTCITIFCFSLFPPVLCCLPVILSCYFSFTPVFPLTNKISALYYLPIMTYTPPKYPTSIPSHLTDSDDLPPWYDDLDWWDAQKPNALRLELCACLSTLGVLPQGTFSTVAERLDWIQSQLGL